MPPTAVDTVQSVPRVDDHLGPRADEWSARAALATPGDGGSIMVDTIGSFDVPAESQEDVEESMRFFLASS